MSTEVDSLIPPAAVRTGPRPIQYVNLETVKPDPAALNLAPGDFALKYQVLPLYVERGVLVAAIGSETSLAAIDNLGVLLDQPVKPVLGDPTLIRELIEEQFIENILSAIPTDDSSLPELDENADLADLQQMASATAVVQMVNLIFS